MRGRHRARPLTLFRSAIRWVAMDTSRKGALGSDEPNDALDPPAPVVLPHSPPLTLESRELYFNRELSLLEFQKRVLEQAQDPRNPLLERVKFLSIVSSNLDEFFMVRVSGLAKQLASDTPGVSLDGLDPATQLRLIRDEVRKLVDDMEGLFGRTLLPALELEGIIVSGISSLTADQRAQLDSYFLQRVQRISGPSWTRISFNVCFRS